MHFSSASVVATLAFLSPLTAAANVGRAEIEARDNVAACKAILIALKASQFCSSFVPIKDVTSTETKTTGTPGYTKVTVTAACTTGHKKKKRGSVTFAVPTTTPSTNPAAPSTTTRVTTTSSTTRGASTTTWLRNARLKAYSPKSPASAAQSSKRLAQALLSLRRSR